MSLYRIQGKAEKLKGIYYEFDPEDKPLGEGGMGKVYKGRCVDEKSGQSRNVAIKFMFTDLPPYAIEKARREAAIQFRHENLVEMLGFIETESKSVLGEPVHCYHVVSELLEGVSLDSVFEGKLTDQQGHFVPYAEKLFKDYQQDPNHFAVEIIKNILSGLMMMHDAGYIHRDIDPTNIMITTDGRIKLIDFGIAKQYNSLTTNDKHLTQAGQFVGKPEYAAPELVLGAINEQNQTTDIYAVGILLFQCIVGHVPFEGDRSDILQKQLHSSLPLNLIKHRGLRKIIATATDKARSKRFQSAAEFRVALERLDLSSNGGGIEIKPIFGYIAGAVAVCAAAVLIGMNIGKKPSASDNGHNHDQIAQAHEVEVTYDDAIELLHSRKTSSEGLMNLQTLSDNGNAKATYMLSRLYFKSKDANDFCPDTIHFFQDVSGIATDNDRAHELLMKTLRQDPSNYFAAYELARDYWKADQRSDVITERDGNLTKKYLDIAKENATKANDDTYITKINELLNDYKKWEKVVKGM